MGATSAASILVGEGHVSLGVDMTKLQEGLKQAQAKLKAWGQGAMAAGTGLFDLGVSMAKMLKPGVTAFADYEQALADLRAASNPNEEQFERIKEKIEEISKSTGIMPVEVAHGFSELLKAGRTVDEVIGGLGETAIKFARVSGVPMAESATVIADAMNVFSRDGLTASRVANILNQAADATTLSLRDVVEAFSQGGSSMGMFNQNMLDTATAVAIMSEGAIKGAQAGTALKTLMTRLATGKGEAGEGEGADEVSKAMHRIGLSVYDTNGKMLPMIEIIRRIKNGLAGLSDAEANQVMKGLAGMRGIQGLLPLLKNGVQGFEDMQKKMADNLSIEEKFAIMTDTLWGAMKKLWVHIQFVAIEIGAALAPALRVVGNVLFPVLNGLQTYVKNNQQIVQMFAMDAVKTIAYGAALYALGTAFMALASAIGFILTPMGIFVVAAAAIGTATYIALSKIVAAFPEVYDPMLYRLTETFTQTWNAVADAIVGGDLTLAWEVVCAGMELVWTRLINYIAGTISDVSYLLIVGFQNAMNVAITAANVAKRMIPGAGLASDIPLLNLEQDARMAVIGEQEFYANSNRAAQQRLDDAEYWAMMAREQQGALGDLLSGAGGPRGQFDASPPIPGAGHSVGTFSAFAIPGMLGGKDRLTEVAEQQLDVQTQQLRAIEASFEWS